MRFDGSWAVEVATRGAVVAATIGWHRSGQLFVTVVAKVAASYATGSDMQLVEARPFEAAHPLGLSELAPSLPQCDVVMIGSASHGVVRVAIERAGAVLFDKRAHIAAFAPVRSPPPRMRSGLTLADDNEFERYQVAPEDQRIPYLQGGEVLVLEGADREHQRVAARLPHRRPRLHLVVRGRRLPVSCQLDSLGIDAVRRHCVLLFRGVCWVATDTPLSCIRAEVVGSTSSAPPSERAATPLADLTGTLVLEAVAKPDVARLGETASIDDTALHTATVPFANPPVAARASRSGSLDKTVVEDSFGLFHTLPFGMQAPPATPFERRGNVAPGSGDDAPPMSGETMSLRPDANWIADLPTPFEAARTTAPPSGAPASVSVEQDERPCAEEDQRMAVQGAQIDRASLEATRAAKAADERRAADARRFAEEQREALQRERVKLAESLEKSRTRAVALRRGLYRFWEHKD